MTTGVPVYVNSCCVVVVLYGVCVCLTGWVVCAVCIGWGGCFVAQAGVATWYRWLVRALLRAHGGC